MVGQPPPRQQPPLNQQQNQVTGKIVLRKLVMGNLTSFHSCKEEILTSIREGGGKRMMVNGRVQSVQRRPRTSEAAEQKQG